MIVACGYIYSSLWRASPVATSVTLIYLCDNTEVAIDGGVRGH
jgi:hypothetical protein